MNIIITNTGGIPIYEQITNQLKEQILSGELKAGDALPSMRVLARELRISVITTKRAYEDLERDGFIESYVGKGSFVKSKSADFLREENLRAIDENLTNAITYAKRCNISLEELSNLLEIIYKGDGTDVWLCNWNKKSFKDIYSL